MINFAMIFPGQGSHKVGMLNKLYIYHNILKKTFDEASNYINYDLWKLITSNNLHQLNKNKYMQAALLTTSVSIYRLWKKKMESYQQLQLVIVLENIQL
ncbi:hypothetical protein [Buchnera aphidicola]|uniref:hypothetical protein n=1 Tax=Buchnera aphidicola TaxID=9 RepID=UPI003463EC9A